MKSKILVYLIICIILSACSNGGANKGTTDSTAFTKKSVINQTDSIQYDSIVVAHVTGGTVTFVVDTNILKSDWQNFMNAQPGLSPATINHIEIIYVDNKYYLRADGTIGADFMKSTMNTHTDSGGGHECIIIGGSDAFTIQCTTSACASEPSGCIPDFTRCTPCANGGKCTKTISSGAAAIFPSIASTPCM